MLENNAMFAKTEKRERSKNKSEGDGEEMKVPYHDILISHMVFPIQ